jgi:glutathione S-transferase
MLNVEKELFEAYAFYTAITVLKMVIMSFLTARQRFKTMTFISSEDAKQPGTKCGTNEDIERVRRAHQNDIENILPFLILGFLYMFTNPAYSTALLCYRIFVGARIFHTIVYLLIVPQPSRALAFFAGIFVNIYMAYKIIATFM